ncbi:MAG: CRISPR-associated RAMP protein Csx7 [bacterium]
MSRADDFDRLRTRVRLIGRITTLTGLRIGASGGGGDAVDLPVMRDAQGYPFLPGASIKGVLRSTLEALVRGAGGTSREAAGATGLWSCDPFDRERGCGQHTSGQRSAQRTDDHCTICHIFGSPIVASHVRITDAMASDRSGAVPIELRDGVSIDRDLGTVHGGQKYDFQVVSPGTAFDLEVFADNIEDWQLGLVMLGFDQIHQGFSGLGGFTSRGLGRVTIAWEALVAFEAPQLFAAGADIAALTAPQALSDTQRAAWTAALAARAGGGR